MGGAAGGGRARTISAGDAPCSRGRTVADGTNDRVFQTALLVLLLLAVLVALGASSACSPGRCRATSARIWRLNPPAVTPSSVSSQAQLLPGSPAARLACQIEPAARDRRGPRPWSACAASPRACRAGGGTQRSGLPGLLFVSRWLGRVDDCEFWFDPRAGVIQGARPAPGAGATSAPTAPAWSRSARSGGRLNGSHRRPLRGISRRPATLRRGTTPARARRRTMRAHGQPCAPTAHAAGVGRSSPAACG